MLEGAGPAPPLDRPHHHLHPQHGQSLTALFDKNNTALRNHAINAALDAGDLSRLPPDLWAMMAQDIGTAPIGLARAFSPGRGFAKTPAIPRGDALAEESPRGSKPLADLAPGDEEVDRAVPAEPAMKALPARPANPILLARCLGLLDPFRSWKSDRTKICARVPWSGTA